MAMPRQHPRLRLARRLHGHLVHGAAWGDLPQQSGGEAGRSVAACATAAAVASGQTREPWRSRGAAQLCI